MSDSPRGDRRTLLLLGAQRMERSYQKDEPSYWPSRRLKAVVVGVHGRGHHHSISLIPFFLVVLWYLLPLALLLGGVGAIMLGRTMGPPDGKIYVEGGVYAVLFGVAIAYRQYLGD
jgi:hypothetical protein